MRTSAIRQILRNLAILAAFTVVTPSVSGAETKGDSNSGTTSAPQTEKSPAPQGDGLFQIAAQVSYRIFHQACDKSSAATSDDERKNEEQYLGTLAGARAKVVDCQSSKIKSLLSDDKKTSQYAIDMASKIAILLELKKQTANQAARLRQFGQNVTHSPDHSQYDAAALDYKQTLAAQEATLQSIEFIEDPHVQNYVKTQLKLFGTGEPPPVEDIVKAVNSQSGVRSALGQAVPSLQEESERLHAGADSKGNSLDTSYRESLAQDTSLIDSTKDYAKTGDDHKATACRVDAKYGKGASIRDNILVTAQVGLTVATLGSGAIANAAFNGSRIATLGGAVRTGEIATKAANILGGAAIAADITGATVQAVKACRNQARTKGVTKGESCTDFAAESIEENNCALNTGLSAIGAVASIPKIRALLTRLALGKTDAEIAVGRDLSADEKIAIEKAHLVGSGELGKDGINPAAVGNYTDAQLKQKAKILKDAGFTQDERRDLIEKEIVGAKSNYPPGIQSKYVSFRDEDGKRTAGILQGPDGNGGYKVLVQSKNGKLFESTIPYQDVSTIKESSTAKLAWSRTGDPEIDSVRDAIQSGKFDNSNRYISYIDSDGNKVIASAYEVKDGKVAVFAENPKTGTPEVRQLSNQDLLSARISDSARARFGNVSRSDGPQTQAVKRIFNGQIDYADKGEQLYSPRYFPSQNHGNVEFNSSVPLSARNQAVANGQIQEIRASQPTKLAPGVYTYAITSDGRLIVGRVNDSFEYGVKHVHLLNGRKAVTAGELNVLPDGSYKFNEDSGSIVKLGLLDNGVDPRKLSARTAEALRRFFGNNGTEVNGGLIPKDPPSRNQLYKYCQENAFCSDRINAYSCREVFGSALCPR